MQNTLKYIHYEGGHEVKRLMCQAKCAYAVNIAANCKNDPKSSIALSTEKPSEWGCTPG